MATVLWGRVYLAACVLAHKTSPKGRKAFIGIGFNKRDDVTTLSVYYTTEPKHAQHLPPVLTVKLFLFYLCSTLGFRFQGRHAGYKAHQ
jgi:hypothetical protein